MDIALKEAKAASEHGDVPIGAVVVDAKTGTVLARAGNRCEQDNDPSGHAEIVAIRQAAAKKGSPRLIDCDLYVTLEPCTMCAGAISLARIRRLYFGAYDPKGGGVDHGARFFNLATCHHKPEVYGGLREKECADLLTSFFEQKR